MNPLIVIDYTIAALCSLSAVMLHITPHNDELGPQTEQWINSAKLFYVMFAGLMMANAGCLLAH